MDRRTAPKDIWEFYALIDDIEASLEANGQGDWAKRLNTTVRGGSTSGEILTYLGVDLDALVASGVPQRLRLCPDVSLACNFVYEALNAVGQRAPRPRACA